MTFDEAIRAAAHEAEEAVRETMRDMRDGHVVDEDDITGCLVGSLHRSFGRHVQPGGLNLRATVLRHRRGTAAEEKRVGADLLIHVEMNTPMQKYSKGVLVQAKKVEPGLRLFPTDHGRLVDQCNRMLERTPAAFVFNYSSKGMRCGSAIRVVGASREVRLNQLCDWTPYRFFLELFRCPIGDGGITSARVDEIPEPFVVKLDLEGDLTAEEGPLL